MSVYGRMPDISRALARGDQTRAFEILSRELDRGEAGRALLELCRTEEPAVLRRQFPSPFGIRLSRRECDYVNAAIQGQTDAEAGDHLYVSENTVKTTWKAILARHGVRNKTALVGKILYALVPDWRAVVTGGGHGDR